MSNSLRHELRRLKDNLVSFNPNFSMRFNGDISDDILDIIFPLLSDVYSITDQTSTYTIIESHRLVIVIYCSKKYTEIEVKPIIDINEQDIDNG